MRTGGGEAETPSQEIQCSHNLVIRRKLNSRGNSLYSVTVAFCSITISCCGCIQKIWNQSQSNPVFPNFFFLEEGGGGGSCPTSAPQIFVFSSPPPFQIVDKVLKKYSIDTFPSPSKYSIPLIPSALRSTGLTQKRNILCD